MQPAFIVLFIITALAALLIQYEIKRRRQQAFAALAAKLGLSYAPSDQWGLDRLPFALFQKGDRRRAENVVWGTHNGNDIKAFDYWYAVRHYNGKTTSTTYYRFSCVVCGLPVVAPYTAIGPETILTRLADMVGLHDIDFESGEFNDQMQVKSTDRKFASYLIDARMMQWLLATKGWNFELSGSTLLCYVGKVAPPLYEQIINAAEGFLQTIPRVVVETYGARR